MICQSFPNQISLLAITYVAWPAPSNFLNTNLSRSIYSLVKICPLWYRYITCGYCVQQKFQVKTRW